MGLIISKTSAAPGEEYNRNASSLLSSLGSRGIPDPSYALSKDVDVLERIRLDPTYSMAMDQLLTEIAGSGYSVVPGGDLPIDKLAAAVLEEMLERLDMAEITEELAQVVFTGREYACFEYGDPENDEDDGREAVSLAGLPATDWLIPDRVKDIDRRRVQWKPTKGADGKTRLVMELWSLERRRWEPIEDPGWIIQHVYGDEECRFGYGRGLLDALYTIWYAKQKAMAEWAVWVERWAHGQAIFTVDTNRLAGTDKTNTAVLNQIIEQAKIFMSRHVAAIGETEKFEVHEASAVGIEGLRAFIDYCDEAGVKRILGALLTTGNSEGTGSKARAQVEERSTSARVKYHQARLYRTLSIQLIGWIWRANWNQLGEVGLQGAKMPKLEPRIEKVQDYEKNAKVLVEANKLVPIKKSQVYEMLGLEQPGPDDEVLDVAAPLPASPFMPPGEGDPPPPKALAS